MLTYYFCYGVKRFSLVTCSKVLTHVMQFSPYKTAQGLLCSFCLQGTTQTLNYFEDQTVFFSILNSIVKTYVMEMQPNS